jgi:hypothetical protein
MARRRTHSWDNRFEGLCWLSKLPFNGWRRSTRSVFKPAALSPQFENRKSVALQWFAPRRLVSFGDSLSLMDVTMKTSSGRTTTLPSSLASVLLLAAVFCSTSLLGQEFVWTRSGVPNADWYAVASSSDGTKLVAVVHGGGIYTSTNSGITWTLTSAPSQPWNSVASSPDGSVVLAAIGNGSTGGIYTSTNSGLTWLPTSAPSANWYSVASSSDGTKVVAVVYVGRIYTSTNSGMTWTLTSAPSRYWNSVASSSDGAKLVAVVNGGGVYSSTNSGVIWMQTSAPTNLHWASVTSSSDGTKLAAAASNFGIYTSTNSGMAWTLTSAPSAAWTSVASSSDGTKLAAGAVLDAGTYISTNSGTTWTSSGSGLSWWSIASSSDGAKLAALAPIAANGGRLYTATWTIIDPPVITAQPTNLLVLSGTSVAFGVSLTGTAPFRYQWRFNDTNQLSATSSIYSIASVATNHAGKYSVVITNPAGTAISSNAALTVVLSPQSQTNYASSMAAFTAIAFSPECLNYQWQRNGTNLVEGDGISGTTNSTLTIASVSDADAADYSAVVSDARGSVTTSNALLTVNDFLSIASQPQSQTVGLGSNVTFSVTAYGAPPFVFQWYSNMTPVGSPSTGTNSSSYTLSNVGTNQAGSYSVEVFNGYGRLLSSNAVLTVKVFPPSIELQPLSQNVMMGSNASFKVSVSGTPPFQYQWRFAGTNILDATNAAYAIEAVGATHTGNYSVVVTNPAGSATSSNALLTVIFPPTLGLRYGAGYPLLSLGGMLGSNFVVQHSTNLAGTNWTLVLSLTNLQASPYLFLDPAGGAQPAWFYRAFMR